VYDPASPAFSNHHLILCSIVFAAVSLPANGKNHQGEAEAVVGLYNVLDSMNHSLREASFSTFTNKERLHEIGTNIKQARDYAETVQRALLSLSRSNQSLKDELWTRSPLVPLLILHDFYR